MRDDQLRGFKTPAAVTLADRLFALIAREENPKRFPRALFVDDFATLREAAELARRVEAATVVTVMGECDNAGYYHIDTDTWPEERAVMELRGQRVRILPEKEPT